MIASMNGSSAESWLRFAKVLEQAGADAIELNLYEVVTDLTTPSIAVERQLVGIVADVKRLVKIPVAVKLSPFFSAFGNMARQFDEAGADALVLFNRFYQPDIDIKTGDRRLARRAVHQRRTAAAPAVDCHPPRPRAAVAGADRRRRDARPTASRPCLPVPTPSRWCRRCCAMAPRT